MCAAIPASDGIGSKPAGGVRLEIFREVVTHPREPFPVVARGQRLGSARGPGRPSPQVLQRKRAVLAEHHRDPDVIVRAPRLFVFPSVRILDRPLHVRLSGREPDLAYQHVGEGFRTARRGHGELVRASGGHRRQIDPPAPGGIGRSGRGLTRDGHGDHFAGLGPPPHGHGGVSLQHRVVGEHRRQPKRRRPGGPGRQARQQGGQNEGSKHDAARCDR